jgi:hypothetical protein
MTYYTNILSTVMYPKSSDLTFDLVFLKIRYFILFFFNILCTCNYFLKHLHVLSWDCNWFEACEVVKQFTVKSHFTCIDEATSSNMVLLNSLHLLI